MGGLRVLNLLYLFFTREKRTVFINKLSFFGRFIASFINIFFYYYAAQAFKPDVQAFGDQGAWSLFEFVMVGEITLFFAIDALVLYSMQTRLIIRENVLDPLLNTKTPLYLSLFWMSLSSQILSLLTVVFNSSVLYFMFKLHYPMLFFLKAVFLNFCFLPLFIALGYLAAAFLLIFRKGSAGLGAVIGVLGILSGAYFPVNVFPSWASQLVKYLNPMYSLLHQTRLILKTGSPTVSYLWLTVGPLVIGLIILSCAILIFNLTVTHYKRRGEPLLLGR